MPIPTPSEILESRGYKVDERVNLFASKGPVEMAVVDNFEPNTRVADIIAAVIARGRLATNERNQKRVADAIWELSDLIDDHDIA